MKMMECPSCFGSKEMFDPELDTMQECVFCRGEGKVTEEKFDLFDPISMDLGFSSDYYVEED